jgi:hypothetical protein
MRSVSVECPESEIRCTKASRIGVILCRNPRQVSNLAAVSFASDTDFDTFVTQEAKACDRLCGNESLTQDTSILP